MACYEETEENRSCEKYELVFMWEIIGRQWLPGMLQGKLGQRPQNGEVLTTQSTCAITSQLFAPKDFGPGR